MAKITLTKRLYLAASLLLLAYLIINFPILKGLLRSVAEHKHDTPAKFGTFFTSLALFYVCLTLAGPRVRVLLIALFAFACHASWTYFRITGTGLSFSQSIWLIEEANQIWNVMISYTLDIVIATVLTLTATGLMLFSSKILHQELASQFAPDRARLLKTAALLGLLVWNGLLAKFIPSSSIHHPIETSTYAYFLTSKIIPIPTSSEVPEQQISAAPFDKVVLLIDESIRSDYFQHYQGAEVARLQGINFGEALAFAPCSSPSNATLRWGYSKVDQVVTQHDPRNNPKIWRYASKAGFATHFIDAQSTGFLQNYMSRNERADISDFQTLDKGRESDLLAAASINRILRTPSKDLILVVKRGAHFPYDLNYPESVKANIKNLPQSYGMAVQYAEKDFFQKTLDGVDMSKTLVLYTSDHGERLDGSKTPHCSLVPSQTEYSVPMVAFTAQPQWREQLLKASQQYQNQTSHLQIFPTLLTAMGYQHQRSVDDYFPTLLDAPGTRYVSLTPFRIFPIDRGGKFPITPVKSMDEIGPKDPHGPNQQ